MFHSVLYDCIELPKAFIFLSFVHMIMKMPLRSHNGYTENALHVNGKVVSALN
jgi:hypothetical protein